MVYILLIVVIVLIVGPPLLGLGSRYNGGF